MSSDAPTGADHTSPPMAPEDLAEASRQLLEQSFNDGKFELADQLIAADGGQPRSGRAGCASCAPRTRGAQAHGEPVSHGFSRRADHRR